MNLVYYLDKTKIVAWARENFNKYQPQSGNPVWVPSYLNFSFIGEDNYDCTNFVSHAILAGGTPTFDTGGWGISSTGWYFRDIVNRSSSWSGVAPLFDFLTHNEVRGPFGEYRRYEDIYSGVFDFEEGDIIQFNNGDFWRHTGIITGFGYSPEGRLEALVTGRTDTGNYNDNTIASEIYPNLPRRVIKLLGYYK
ncbi:MAG: amidase domain-containing protein [Oscillospiraceae bacterium]|nr:amidase domain-containing protein [Oscillospiraceae bacterium]